MVEKQEHSWALTLEDTNMLKGIAILAMLLHHTYGCPPEGFGPFNSVLTFFGVLGKVCVAIFLFCSGYGLSVKYGQLMDEHEEDLVTRLKTTLKFIGRRFVKFYANYWLVFLIFVPISIFVFNRPLMIAYGEDACLWKNMLLDVLGVNGFNSYNITWWFNKLIILLYILFPILFFFIRKIKWGVLLLSILLARASCHLPGWMDTVSLLTYQMPFIFGIYWQQNERQAAQCKLWLEEHKIIATIGVLVLLLITIVLRMYPIIPHWEGMRMDAFVSMALCLCVLLVKSRISWINNLFAFLGKHSMNMYMTHTFFLAYWFSDKLYMCEGILGGVFMVLLVICVIVSLLLEWIKEKICLTKLISLFS